MHSHTIKIVLLLAVSVSQVAGGLSCCCLPRLLASTLSSSFQSTVAIKVSGAESADKTACPKCCHSNAESKSTATIAKNIWGKGQTTTISSDGQCNCARPISICMLEEVSIGGRELAQQPPSIPYFIGKYDFLTRLANVKTSYSPPLRYMPDGRSWQSFACIWIA